MTLENPPFVRQYLETKEDTFTVKLNEEERAWLEKMKILISQPKDSTALKQLAKISELVLLDEKLMKIAAIIYENKLKNKRNKIPGFS